VSGARDRNGGTITNGDCRKRRGKTSYRKFIFEDICEDALESKIQSVHAWFRVKLFMAAMKAA
jgi:hypothetical protein